jgi:two-component system response regulator CpxR
MIDPTSDGKIKVLIVDDDEKLCELVREYLAAFGYDVDSATTGPAGLKKALRHEYRAVILDVMLPGMDGFEVLRALRRESDVPVLMLTARGEETDRIVGLEMGADDYLPKTFSTRELLARLRAVTRRSSRSDSATGQKDELPMVAGELRVDLASRSAFLGDQPLELTTVELDLLACLVRAEGRVLSREQILEQVSERDYDIFDRSVDVHISSLRRKLGDDPKCPRFIKTIRSVGYMFIEQPPHAVR